MTCESYNGGTLVICRGPVMEEVWRIPEGERWCFVCRKRRDFERIGYAPVIPENPTIDDLPWYGPHSEIHCPSCHTMDGDVFPGRYREYRDE